MINLELLNFNAVSNFEIVCEIDYDFKLWDFLKFLS